MKRRSKIKEVAFLAVPCLLLAAIAFYWARFKPVQPTGIYISNVELVPADGRHRAMGISHYMKVTIDHHWPRPHWWTNPPGNMALGESIHALTTPSKPFAFHLVNVQGERPGQLVHVASGGAVTWQQNGKRQQLLSKVPIANNFMGTAEWTNGSLVFRHDLSLENLPTSQQTVRFQGLYFVNGEPPLRVNRVIRAPDMPLKWDDSRETGAQLVSISAKPFEHLKFSNAPSQDETRVSIAFMLPPSAQGKSVKVSRYDWSLTDGKGHVRPLNSRNFGVGYPADEDFPEGTPVKSLVQKRSIVLYIYSSFPTVEPLTLHGKLSIDDQWPIPLSLRLPPRHKP